MYGYESELSLKSNKLVNVLAYKDEDLDTSQESIKSKKSNTPAPLRK